MRATLAPILASDGRVLLDVEVPGAAVVAIHEFRYAGYTYRGLGAQLAPAVLRDGRWPITTRSPGTGRGMLPLTWAGLRLGKHLQRGGLRTMAGSLVIAAGVLTLAGPWLMQVPALHGVLEALGCRSLPT